MHNADDDQGECGTDEGVIIDDEDPLQLSSEPGLASQTSAFGFTSETDKRIHGVRGCTHASCKMPAVASSKGASPMLLTMSVAVPEL